VYPRIWTPIVGIDFGREFVFVSVTS